MHKLLCTLLSFVLCATWSFAQAPHIEKSEPFDEPDEGYNKVLMMKNGNTMYFHFARKEGIEINVFDKQRKLTHTQEVSSDMWDTRKMKNITVAGLYEINGEAVLFVIDAEGRTPTLYRLRFNGNTGAKVREEELGSSGKSRALALVKETNSIFIEKDPESDCYAVIFFNGYSKDPDDKIRVIHFDGSHNKLSTALYDSPDDNFRYLRYISSVVDGKNRVFLATYGAAGLNGRDGHVFISVLPAGGKKFTNKTLNFTEDFKDTKSVMNYNRTNNTLQLLTISYTKGEVSFFGAGTKHVYMSVMSYIDPETLELKSVKPQEGTKIAEYADKVLNTSSNYRGMPEDMIINSDNSITILQEEIAYEQRVTRTQNATIVQYFTYLGGIGVSELNADGTEKAGFWIRKRQQADGLYEPLYMCSRHKGRWSDMGGKADHNSYMSYDYFNTGKNRYIIFNDNDKNFDKDEDEKKRKVVTKVNKLNTVCYALAGGTVNKSYLFGDPGDDNISNEVHIDASDFDKSTGTYATIMVERDGRDRSAKMVWIKFD